MPGSYWPKHWIKQGGGGAAQKYPEKPLPLEPGGPGESAHMRVGLVTFAYKHGRAARPDCDLLIDLRRPPDPRDHLDFSKRDGRDANVRRWLFSHENARIAYRRALAASGRAVEKHRKRGHVLIALGSWAGTHRSVAIAERLAEDLATFGQIIDVVHLELEKGAGDG